MAGIDSFYTLLKNLQHQAGILSEAVVSLNKSFEAEAVRLTREDGASRLRALHRAVVEQLERVKCSESSASYVQSQINQTASASTLGMSLGRAMVSKGNRLSTFSNSLRSVSIKKPPFGNVLVGIGPNGLPEDVKVISISELARKSKCLESEVILQQAGFLLFSQEAFSSFIDKLVADIREGQLCLPLPSKKVSEIGESYYLAIESKQSKWVPYSRPQ